MSTYTPIASVTLSSAQSSVTFSGIPQTYTDLVVVLDAKSTNSDNVLARVNGDSGSNYSITRLSGNGSTASSARGSNQTYLNFDGGAYLTTGSSVWTIQFMNYSNTTTNKTILSRGNNAATGVDASVNLWRSTSAITSINFITTSNNFASGSTFNLYGIANASITNVAKATGGDSVYTDGTYWYHIFRSSGTFTPTQALTADYLVVAGGGGGGTAGGGGGAGGLRSTVTATGGGGSLESPLSLTAQAYTVTVGAGGNGTPGGSPYPQASDGNDSVFSTITSTKGGGGGGYGTNGAGRNGGSGGGEGADSTNGAGTGTTNQGFGGGTGGGSGGGGGGAGAVGQSVSGSSNGGNGGNGVAVSISGSSVTYAGGGGGCATAGYVGGAGGTGGGGAGAITSSAGTNGTANTGGGGGAAGNSGTATGGNGGSGIVIIRYSAAA